MKKEDSCACALTGLRAGCRAKVARVDGSDAERSRLNALGLTPQADIEVINCCCGWQVIKVRGCSLVLNDDVARHITCSLEPVSQIQLGE